MCAPLYAIHNDVIDAESILRIFLDISWTPQHPSPFPFFSFPFSFLPLLLSLLPSHLLSLEIDPLDLKSS